MIHKIQHFKKVPQHILVQIKSENYEINKKKTHRDVKTLFN